jgi:hypothetical protein
MNECIQENLTAFILSAVALGGSLITNIILYCRLHELNEPKNIKLTEEHIGIEMVSLDHNNQLENYVMTLGDSR